VPKQEIASLRSARNDSKNRVFGQQLISDSCNSKDMEKINEKKQLTNKRLHRREFIIKGSLLFFPLFFLKIICHSLLETIDVLIMEIEDMF
ncbi:MAG: hypothetical protein ACE5HX_03750, partial [bacterium]